MGIGFATGMIIAYDDVQVMSLGPDEHGKYQGMICYNKNHERHPCMPLVSSPFKYDSATEAKEAMDKVITLIRKQELEKEEK